MRICLVGASHSGKTTLADYLRDEHGWMKINYTDELKRLAATALIGMDVPGYEDFPTEEDIVRDKARFRPFLNELGTLLGFDKGYGMNRKLAEWAALGSPEPVVWDCVRSEAQYERLKELGFVLVGLSADYFTLMGRALANGVTQEEQDRQWEWDEANLPAPEIILDGTWDTEELAGILQRLAGAYRTEAAHVSSLKHAA